MTDATRNLVLGPRRGHWSLVTGHWSFSGHRLLLLVALIAVVAPGCTLPQPSELLAPPSRHSLRAQELLVLSDFKLPKEHPLVRDLVALRDRILAELQLPTPREQVVVYLFDDEAKYFEYLDATYPGLPRRRAYFVGTPRELAVYTYWGQRIQEDLRHEYTHGILHACLKNVPLWLDEGLAEYFEVAGPGPAPVNAESAADLSEALAGGWRPDLVRLESLEKFEQMQRIDYQEAWAWMHYLLHASPETREVLLTYLHDLRTETAPRPLSRRLLTASPEASPRFVAYITSLGTRKLLSDEPQWRIEK